LQSPPLSAHWARLQTAGVEVIGESTAEVSRTASGSSFFAEGPYRSYAVIDARRGGIRRALGARARLGWARHSQDWTCGRSTTGWAVPRVNCWPPPAPRRARRGHRAPRARRDPIVTSDPRGVEPLARAARRHVEIVAV
jgi:hypothetical protein